MRAVVVVASCFRAVGRFVIRFGSLASAGSCVIGLCAPKDSLRYPRAEVQYSKIKVGTIGSTFGAVDDADDDEDDEYGDDRRLDEVLI